MRKEEIIQGLKNAIERGSDLEQAKQSFINAGYDEREINDAAASLQGTLTEYPEFELTSQMPPAQTPEIKPQAYKLPIQKQNFQQQSQFQPPKQDKSKKWLIILI